MNIFYNLFYHGWAFLNFITTSFCLYYICLALTGLFKHKPLPEAKKQHRFAAIIAARNEAAVVPELIESLRAQRYPQELLDIFVVADNCDDDTAEVARKAGAIVYERSNKNEIGKSYVLKFAFEHIFAERDIYDAFCVLDADNIVDPEFVAAMNRAYEAGYYIAQGYRDIKNPEDTWVSGGHSVFFWMQNRFYNAARSFLGLSATINGTGFMVRSALIKKVGFDMETLTEDLELTMKSVLAGYRVGWVQEAVIYDEQPLTISVSVSQRVRWTTGALQVCRKFAGSFARKILSKPSWTDVDILIFLCSVPVLIIGIFSTLLYFIMAAFRLVDPVGFLINTGALLGVAVIGFWAVAFFAILTENKDPRRMMKAIWTSPIFNASWVLIYLICILHPKSHRWTPIVHNRKISLSEIEASKAKP